MDSGDAKGPGGQPIAEPATETGQKNTYAFNYPLKPGETQFQISYHLPYNGEASFSPKPLADVQHFVVMLPKGMSFTPKNPQAFQSMPDKSGSTIMVATNVKPGQDLSFRIAGTGVFQQEGQEEAGGATTEVEQERWAEGRPRPTTIVPAADWARRSTLPTRCTSTARSSSARSPWCW